VQPLGRLFSRTNRQQTKHEDWTRMQGRINLQIRNNCDTKLFSFKCAKLSTEHEGRLFKRLANPFWPLCFKLCVGRILVAAFLFDSIFCFLCDGRSVALTFRVALSFLYVWTLSGSCFLGCAAKSLSKYYHYPKCFIIRWITKTKRYLSSDDFGRTWSELIRRALYYSDGLQPSRRFSTSFPRPAISLFSPKQIF